MGMSKDERKRAIQEYRRAVLNGAPLEEIQRMELDMYGTGFPATRTQERLEERRDFFQRQIERTVKNFDFESIPGWD